MTVRRVIETVQARRSRARTPAAGPGTDQKIVCVVPLFQEQPVAAETVRFWLSVAADKLVDRVILVTSVKERPGSGGESTHEVVSRTLGELALDGPPDRLALIQCPTSARYRAAQLDFAVDDAVEHLGVQDPRELWVGVYNADSRPDAGTFAELRAAAAAEPGTRLFQQLVDYVVPARDGTGLVALGNAELQTWWTDAHYTERNRAGARGTSVLSRSTPYSTFGHGEFARGDFLRDIGGFPDFAYADGLLLGWVCRLMAEPIGLLASRDKAEVPRRAGHLLLQQQAWMRGLLNVGPTVEWCRAKGLLRLSATELRALRLRHSAIPLAWGLSTAAVAWGVGTSVRRVILDGATAVDLSIVAALVAYPVAPALSPPPHLRDVSLPRRVLGVFASWPVEGLAYWPALAKHAVRDSQAPAKTPR